MSADRPAYRPPDGYRRLRLTAAWDGGSYAGWQAQPDMASVQDTLHAALARLTPGAFRAVAAGRTDAGVHAEAMPVHVDVPAAFGVPVDRLARALNAHLPPTIAVLHAMEAAPGFHARFSCTGRRYVYRVLASPQRHPLWHGRALHVPQRLDAPAMNAAATHLLGTHDFAAFATQEERHTVRDLRALHVVPGPLVWEVHVHGESFLRHMVRGLVGTLLLVGLGRLEPDGVRDILRGLDRSRAGANVPAHGLYFAGAEYADLGD
ncbi:tRNA pseudouridine38-40 synthase [Deinococcus metalli]|uniref:tRNA pseudouridine synthase A n=1 Tax=Deinococcus metalli TaxID=1141878 RepID=A0A7W8NQP2_9DEIO|nr:tRNA pseudouridine(38-40) synthase TruA [Deinococcus metalli]MBB5376068.1 tRNA pseudouridine38-40 synthase [Deinococcus metalli]GHF41047.1 tRNA pseudouridine synthase A [Deinococcus metalli]